MENYCFSSQTLRNKNCNNQGQPDCDNLRWCPQIKLLWCVTSHSFNHSQLKKEARYSSLKAEDQDFDPAAFSLCSCYSFKPSRGQRRIVVHHKVATHPTSSHLETTHHFPLQRLRLSADMRNKAKSLPLLRLYLQDGHYHRRWRPYLACSPLGNTGCKKASDKSNHGRMLPNLSINCLRNLWGHVCFFWAQNTPTVLTSFILLYVSSTWG